MAGGSQEDHAQCPNGGSVFRRVQADDTTQGWAVRLVQKWIGFLPEQVELVLLTHLVQVIRRQRLEQRNQGPHCPGESRSQAGIRTWARRRWLGLSSGIRWMAAPDRQENKKVLSHPIGLTRGWRSRNWISVRRIIQEPVVISQGCWHVACPGQIWHRKSENWSIQGRSQGEYSLDRLRKEGLSAHPAPMTLFTSARWTLCVIIIILNYMFIYQPRAIEFLQ